MNHDEMSTKVQSHDEILLGRNGEPGVAHKVGFMWRIQIWAIGFIGTAFGFLLKTVYDTIAHWGGRT